MNINKTNKNKNTIQSNEELINVKGKLLKFNAIEIEGIKIVIKGRFIKIAEVREEWDQDINNLEIYFKNS